MRNSRTWFLYLIVIFGLQMGVVLKLGNIGDIDITVYNLVVPISIVLMVFWMSFTLNISRHFQIYFLINTLLLSGIIATGEPGIPVRILLSYILALGMVTALNFDVIKNPYPVLFYAFVVGTFPLIVVDLAAFVGFIPLNEASVVIPGIQKGGIGIPGGAFGTHGIVASTGFLSGLGLLSRYQLGGYQRKLIIVCLPVLLLVITASQSRSSMIAVSGGTAVFILYYFDKNFGRGLTVGVVTVVFSLIAALGVLLARQRLQTAFGRLSQLHAAYDVFQSNWLFGIGWGNFFPEYYTHVIHFTPANYFISGGVIVGVFFLIVLSYPLVISIRSVINIRNHYAVIVLSAMYVAVVIELMFYKSTPNVHLLVIGGLICNSTSNLTRLPSSESSANGS